MQYLARSKAPESKSVHPTGIRLIRLCFLGWALSLAACTVPFVKTDEPLSEVPHIYDVENPQFLRTFGQMLGPPVVDGNRIETLLNGDQIFPSMLDAINRAERSITFETYIFWKGSIGDRFTEALIARANDGVIVKIILDWYGAKEISEGAIEKMKAANIEVVQYHPLKWYDLPSLDRRTHRKLLVVDGKIGFTGGVGIGDEWLGNADREDHWRDTHYKIEGPAVAQLQAAFMDNWLKSRATVLGGEEFFPELRPQGTSLAQMFRSSPEEGSSSVQVMYLMSIAAASKEILIESAYFVPDEVSLQTLISAKKRGVNVEIIVPGSKSDSALVRTASRRSWGKLLEAGIKIYEYKPTMFHCKVMVVDGLWSSVGSTNFDNRSFRLNEEANLNIYDASFAASQRAIFEQDKLRSKEITFDQWSKRSFWAKFKEKILYFIEDKL